MPSFGQWVYTVDRGGTIAAYERAECGGADTCDCAYCRNFRLARVHVFPEAFPAFLDQLGIDANKDAEVYHTHQVLPGQHFYAGWFHFVGSLEATGDFPQVEFGSAFKVWMCSANAPRLAAFKDLPVVELNFSCDAVPWLLNEPEPT